MNPILFGLLVIAVNCLLVAHAGLENFVSSGSHSAGFIGNYAGHLSAGSALSQLHLDKAAADVEEHDFSEDVATDGEYSAHSENGGGSLSGLGDHLDVQHFPADYGSEHAHQADNAHVAFDEETNGAASAYYTKFDEPAKWDVQKFEEVSQSNEINSFDDFHSKPVPGIDHGKGAFSYSTTYEFKEPEQESALHHHSY